VDVCEGVGEADKGSAAVTLEAVVAAGVGVNMTNMRTFVNNEQL
jgi:hypothetical protein